MMIMAAFLPLALAGQSVSTGETAGFYEVEGIRIPVHVVTVTEEGAEKPSEKGNTPPSKSSRYVFGTSLGNFVVSYSRFLNRSTEWQGKHGASTIFDMGLGIPGFGGNWYGGNTLRVTIDGDDVMARLAADRVEWKAGPGAARWQALWKTEKGTLAITVAVLDGVTAGLVEIAYEGTATEIELALSCFPGGFGPSYGTPSMRAIRAGNESVQLAIGEVSKTVTIPAEADGIFYCDRWPESQKIAGSGSCGLVFRGEQIAAKTVMMSNYGQATTLKLRPGTKSAVLALTEYALPNATAWETFSREQSRLRELLKTTEFWKKEK